MKNEPSDQDEETRSETAFEQNRLGSLILAFLLLIAVAVFAKCTAHAAECSLSWDAPPPSQQVKAWKIYRGIDLLATTTSNSVTLDLSTSAVTTLAVRAVNSIGESVPAIIHIVPFVPSFPSPGTLTGWQPIERKTIFRERSHCDFARYGYPTFTLP